MISFMTSLNVWNSTGQNSKQMFRTLKQKNKAHSSSPSLLIAPNGPHETASHKTQNRGLMLKISNINILKHRRKKERKQNPVLTNM